jgi:hypothetical protein
MFGMISSVVFFHNLFVFFANVQTVKKSTFDGFHGLPVDPYFFFFFGIFLCTYNTFKHSMYLDIDVPGA